MNWKNHIDCISVKVSRAIGIVKRLRHVISFDILVMLYNTLILPHIDYCILAWGYQSDKILLLQKKCLRVITGSIFFAHSDPLFKSIGFLKVEDIFVTTKIKYALNI